jgi:8-oxo-dGTP diphosphatase
LTARRPGDPTDEPLETIDEAAARALAAKTGLSMAADTEAVSAHNAAARVHLEQLRTYGDQSRDPRMTVVSVAYVALAPALPEPTAGHGTTDARWVPIAQLEIDHEDGRVSQNATAYPLAFDHAQIIADAVERARAKLEYSPLAAAFVGEEFSISDLRHVYEIVWGEPLHPSNFARKVLSTPGFVEGTGRLSSETDAKGGPRAKLYRSGDCALLHPPILRAATERKIR